MKNFRSGLILAALALGTACSSDSPTGPGAGGVLTLGTALSVSGSADSERYYTVVVPAGAPALRVSLSGGSGDADIYVRFNARPTEALFDCESSGFDNNEECNIVSPAAGTWHILVLGFEAYSGAQLIAEVVAAPVVALTLGTPLAVAGPGNSERYYTVVVPAGTPALSVTLSGGSGDADLVIRFDAQPIPSNFECGSFEFANEEECLVINPAAGTWHILVFGAEAYTGVQLLAQTVASPVTALTSGVALTNLSGAEGSRRYFSITVPAGATNLTVTTSGGSGDLDLFTRFNGLPSFPVNACGSAGDSNAESCVTATPTAGTWYIMLNGFNAYDGATLTATVTVP